MAYWLLQRCYRAWTDFWLDDVELKRLRAEVNEMHAETKRKDNLVDADVKLVDADVKKLEAEA